MRTQNPRFRLAATVAVSALLLPQVLPQPAMAQGAPPPLRPAGAQDQQGGDPPTRVGRLAQLSGTVSFHAQDEDQWNPATLNFPVVQGNAFWTEPNAQAVIEVSASRIAMAPGTELDVATLTDTAFQATEAQGELYLRVRAATPDETYAVQTPRGLVTLTAPGRYGVVAGDTQNPTTVTVVEGSARVEGPGVSLDLGANQTASVTGSDTFQAEVGPAQRDAFLTAMLAGERPPQPQGVAPPPVVAAMPGGDDLAQYGSWSDNPEYGQVWYPQVAQDWVPYREGRWAYVAPWGWTWVDSAPWGFAPFHYGRWVEAGGRWGWIPGGGVGRSAAGLCARAGDLPRRWRRSRHRDRCRAGRRPGRLVATGAARAVPSVVSRERPLLPAGQRHACDQLHHHQPRRHDQQFRQSPRGDGRADQRDDRLASGGDRVPAGRSGAACAGAAGVRPAAAAPGAHHRRRDAGGRPPVGLAAVVAGPAHDRAGTHVPCRAGWRLDRRRRGGGDGSSGPADVAQPGAAEPAGCRRVGASVHRNASVARAGAGADRAAGDTARAGLRRPGCRFANASAGQSR